MNTILKAHKYVLSFILLLNSHMAYSLVLHVPIDDLTGRSDYIAVGTVMSISTRMGPRQLMIWTDYHLKVSEWYKGSGDDDLTISFAGGEIDGRSIAVSETIRLTKGKEYIVFGYDSSKHYSSPTVGVSQGVFQVIRNADASACLTSITLSDLTTIILSG